MKSRSSKLNYDRYGYFFIAPFFIVFLVFGLYSMVYTFNLSFTDLKGWNRDYNYVGFKNFVDLFHNPLFMKSFYNTFIIWIMNFVPQITLAIILAAMFTNPRLKLRGQGIFKVLFYLPNIITAASVSVLFYVLFNHPTGPINQLLVNFGILEEPYNFFRDKLASRSIVAFIQFWMWYGSNMLILIAAMLGISPSLYESAMVDGASNTKIFFKITLPLIKPILLYNLITSLIGGTQMFDIPFLLLGGAPDYSTETIAMFIYKQAFTGANNYYIASAASVVLFLVVILLSAIIFKFFHMEPERKRKGVK
ncbi:carbohydrate ABC transporter permease [Paenibacillus paeoniae]|uniref:Sugar ABC transporter permease n=1 Tax=Paenibacillus paeoniae TaxID=2292705 RepID=A0A371PGZ1_9BACL|nr:sugar ABC transporter permease [Paenibacillus paeoniae]REK75134.1 sugar ABC transporter permease [Paenibacillus paeoniae]